VAIVNTSWEKGKVSTKAGQLHNSMFSREIPPLYFSGTWNEHHEEEIDLIREMINLDLAETVAE